MKDKLRFKKERKINNFFGYVIIFIVIFTVTIVPILLQPYNDSNINRFAKKENWPITTATIERIYPERSNHIRRRYKFSYWVNDNNFVNMEIADRYTSIFSRKPDGTKVKIRYNPERLNAIVVVQEDANVIYNRTKDLIFIGIGVVVLISVLAVIKKGKLNKLKDI